MGGLDDAGVDAHDVRLALARIQEQVRTEAVRVTQHAQQEMTEEGVTLGDVLEAMVQGTILEHYPEHRRGACCLLGGRTHSGQPLHIVCTTNQAVLVLITVYEPKPPNWVTPTQRRRG